MRNKQFFMPLLILTLALAALLPWQMARADTYVVTNSNNSGAGSLRQAIIDANANPGADTIGFNIPASTDPGCNAGAGVCTIQPIIALPILADDGTTIDGYTQDSAAPATDTGAAVLKIEIDGTSAGYSNGFYITSAGNVIKGLEINRFPWSGISPSPKDSTPVPTFSSKKQYSAPMTTGAVCVILWVRY